MTKGGKAFAAKRAFPPEAGSGSAAGRHVPARGVTGATETYADIVASVFFRPLFREKI